MNLHDAHLHFQFEELVPHHARIDADLRAIGLRHGVVNGTNEAEWPVVASLARRHPWIIPSFGIHPWDCGHRSGQWLENLRAALLSEPRAHVGEIGLDRFILRLKPDDPRLAGLRVCPFEEQTEVFSAQLALAAEFNRAASIHCVQAYGALLDALQATPRPSRGFLLHGYGGPFELIKPFADLGAYFSFNVEWLDSRHAARLDNFRKIPSDRLLVETDAPTKPPPPALNRHPLGPDGAINHPANLAVAYEQLAKLRATPLDQLAAQITANFHRLFL